jgi:hypothetical protein
LANGIFANFPNGKKKELTENLINIAFYPSTYIEKNKSLLEAYNAGYDELNAIEYLYIQENWLVNSLDNIGSAITGTARLFKQILLLAAFLLISPATTLIGGGLTRVADSALRKASDGQIPQNLGVSPTARKIYDFLDHIFVVKYIYDFLNKDLLEVTKFLKKANNLEDPYIEDILKEMGANRTNIIKKCWDKNKYQMPQSEENRTFMNYITHLFNGKGLANFLRNPLYTGENQISILLKSDAANPKLQKMFYDFRVCVYDKLFEIIVGYAKAVYSTNDSSYEIIKYAEEAHKQKNFKKFFSLHPKEASEEAMYNIMKALLAIDEITHVLEKQRTILTADKYIDKFIEYLRQNLKLVFKELDELANQRQYNVDRYKAEQPTDEEKAEAAKEANFNQKKSIFELQ